MDLGQMMSSLWSAARKREATPRYSEKPSWGVRMCEAFTFPAYASNKFAGLFGIQRKAAHPAEEP